MKKALFAFFHKKSFLFKILYPLYNSFRVFYAAALFQFVHVVRDDGSRLGRSDTRVHDKVVIIYIAPL